MSNIFEYIEKYKDCTFQNEPFNDVDNLILCRLAYLDFYDCSGITLRKSAEKIDADIHKKSMDKIEKITYKLLKSASESLRFGNIVILNFIDETDEDKYSFTAVTFKLTSDTSYIAFRGTDDTMASIYEDVAMSSEFPVISQLKAFDYVQNHYHLVGDKFYIGGHSKGGNLALFSYIFVSESIKENIIAVFNNDGPGFPKEYAFLCDDTVSYNKVKFIAPKESIVGRLLFFDAKYTIVDSKSFLLKQHNIFEWQIEDKSLKSVSEFSPTSNMLDRVFKTSITSMNSTQLANVNSYVNNLFDKFNLNNKDDVNINAIAKIVAFMLDDEEKATSQELISNLTKALGKGFATAFYDIVDKNIRDRLNEQKDT